jgi:lipopolysaccharide export system protein LptA
MRFRPLVFLSLCVSSSAILVAVHAQGTKKPVQPAKQNPAPDKTTEGNVIVSGDNSISDDATGISRLTKNVTVTQVGEDFILYAQSLTYNSRLDRAVATENLRVETRDSTIKGLRIDADFNTKILTLTGNVVISTHGQGDGITGRRDDKTARGQLTRKSSKIICDRVDWDYETREAVLTGHIRMVQGKSEGTCDRILFDERQNVAQLKGRVRFTDEKGQVFNTPDLTIYMDEDRIVTGRSRIWLKPNRPAGAAPRPVKPPVANKKAPKISDEDLKLFNITPPPIPPLLPEPTE